MATEEAARLRQAVEVPIDREVGGRRHQGQRVSDQYGEGYTNLERCPRPFAAEIKGR